MYTKLMSPEIFFKLLEIHLSVALATLPGAPPVSPGSQIRVLPGDQHGPHGLGAVSPVNRDAVTQALLV